MRSIRGRGLFGGRELFEEIWYIDFLLIPTPLVSVLFCSSIPSLLFVHFKNDFRSCIYIIELVYSISRDERDVPLTQYITNAGISRARYTTTHFKHHHRVLRLISNRMSV